jgi:predicted Ser/Thr protein kinase
MQCPQCATSLPDEAGFCLRCGASLPASRGTRESVDPLQAALARGIGVQYDIGRLLGRGGMGAVYCAREKALDREVAIKVLPPDAVEGSPDNRERFRREARIAAQLQHSNIVPLYTFGETEGLTFFIMGYVRGESLGARLKREGPLPPEVAKRILAEVADALDYAHKKGVVHRDLKPDNVLIEDDTGRAMLADFGIAKVHAGDGALTRTGMVVGTPTYMSPEQAAGERNVDGRSDLYALGVLGYEMLSGRAVFKGDTAQDVLMQHVTQAPVPLRAVAPDVPAVVAAAVMRCLEKDPARRFADGKALREALDLPDDSDALVPEDLRSMRGYVPITLASLYVYGLFGLGVSVHQTIPELRWMLAQGIGLLWLVTVGVGVVFACKCRWMGKHPWSEIRRAVMLPPNWWLFPWPRRWSPPRVAGHLPSTIVWWRRTWLGFVGVVLGAALPLIVAGLFGPAKHSDALVTAGGIALVLAEVPLISLMLYANRWGKKRGLKERESARLCSAPLTSPFWRLPQIAALFPPGPAIVRSAGEPGSPQELLRAITDCARQFGEVFRELTDAATAAARDAVTEIDALDREIASLAAEANPAEVSRLEQRMAALPPDSSLRPLLTNQLELLHSLARRTEGLVQRRARVLDTVRTLWLQLVNLRAMRSADEAQATEITGRIRALCASVAHEISAEQETVQLLSSSK